MSDSDASQSMIHGQQQRKQSRPKSAVYQAVEAKMFLLDQLHVRRDKEDTEEQLDAEQLQVAVRDEEEADDDQEEEEAEENEEQREQEEGEEEEDEGKEEEEEKETEDEPRAEYDCTSYC